MEKYKKIGQVYEMYEGYFTITFRGFEFMIKKVNLEITKDTRSINEDCGCCYKYTKLKATKEEKEIVYQMVKSYIVQQALDEDSND